VRFWAMGPDGHQVERSFSADTLANAKRIRAQHQAREHPGGNITLAAWHEQYWKVIETSVRPATARAYERGWRLRVKPAMGHKKLEAISAGDIEAAMQAWSGGPSTHVDALAVLSRLLDGAVRARRIPLNVARLARRPRVAQTLNLRSRALTAGEVKALLEAVDEPWRGYLAALAYTGMRANEATALQVGDVDLEGRSIHVHRSLTISLEGRPVEVSPKSHKERVVPITAALVPHLVAAMQGKRRSDPVFTGPKGGILSTSNVRRGVRWNELRRTLDRPELRLHDLRHTFATLLFDAGANAHDVQALLAHSSMELTQRYARSRADVARRGAQALDNLLGEHRLSGPEL